MVKRLESANEFYTGLPLLVPTVLIENGRGGGSPKENQGFLIRRISNGR